MKAMKRTLAAILSLLMTVSMFSVVASAEERPLSQVNPTTIDETRKDATLTIHKYEYNGDWENDLGTATGESGDASSLPGNSSSNFATAGTLIKDNNGNTVANALQDATFTIYQIVNATDLKNYYSTNPDYLPTVDDVLDANGDFKSAYNNVTAYASGKTGANGQVIFGNENNNVSELELGLYLVVETKAPDSVYKLSEPFMVSIPMTTTDGKDWLYDVHVFPKNKTHYTDVSLYKTGDSGNGSLVPLSGVNFKLLKYNKDVSKATSATKAVTANWTQIEYGANATGDNQLDENDKAIQPAEGGDTTAGTTGAVDSRDMKLDLTTGSDGWLTASHLTQGLYRFYETDLGGTNGDANKNYILNKDAYYEFEISVDKDGNSTITAKNYTAITNSKDSNKVNAIPVVNYKPTLDKQVLPKGVTADATAEADDSEYKLNADYSIGDAVHYRLSIYVPKNVNDLVSFKVIDTPEHAKYKTGTVVIYDEDRTKIYDANSSTLDKTITVGADTTGGKGFSIEFNGSSSSDSALKSYAGQNIIIEYDAVLQKDAVVTSDGNKNTATLQYSNVIDSSLSDADVPTDKITEQAIVYTFQLSIHKIGRTKDASTSDDVDTDLNGVKFSLYREASSASEIFEDGFTYNETSNPTGFELVAGANVTQTNGLKKLGDINNFVKIATLTTANGGLASYSGLSAGTYYLVEEDTATGYNLLKDPVRLIISVDYESEETELTASTDSSGNDSAGHIIANKKDASGNPLYNENVSGIDSKNSSLGNSAVTSLTTVANANSAVDGIFWAEIINKQGYELPATGGMGTILFLAIGGVLFAGGAYMFIIRNRKRSATVAN